MDNAPELLPTAEVVPPQEAPLRAGTYIREAAFDLLAGLGLGLLVLVAVFVAMLLTGRDPSASFTSGWGIAILLLGTQLPLLFRALRRRRLNRLKQRPVLPLFGGPTAPAILRGVITGVLLAVLSSLYANTLLYWLGEGSVDNQIDFLKDLLSDRPVVALLVFLIAVVAPICEEIVFRGVMFGSAHAAGLSIVGVALSAVLFATVHLLPLLAPFYAFFGVVMCWLYVRTGTLAAPIAAHMAMNGLACAALLLQGDNLV